MPMRRHGLLMRTPDRGYEEPVDSMKDDLRRAGDLFAWQYSRFVLFFGFHFAGEGD
jgi:hypothetical protein